MPCKYLTFLFQTELVVNKKQIRFSILIDSEGLKEDNDGQYINLNEMSKIDKEKLKQALAPMRELEELIKDKFQLTQFS